MKNHKKILILKAGSTFPYILSKLGDFDDWIISGTGLPKERFLTVSVFNNETLPALKGLSGIVITGSHDMVTDKAEWMKRTAVWLKDAVLKGVPTLGICFGHQLLAYAFDGVVADNPVGKEIGTLEVEFNNKKKNDALFGAIDDKIKAQLSHTQSVIRVPAGAIVLASSEQDPHQVIRYGEKAWSVQFHPEFSAEALKAYLSYNRIALEAAGQDVDDLIEGVGPTSESAGFLQKFADLLIENG